MKKCILVTMFSLLVVMCAHAESTDTLQSNNIVSKNATAKTDFLGTGNHSFTLGLPEIQVDLSPTNPGEHKSGVVYQLPTPITADQLSWEPVTGGFAARIHVNTVQAKRLRVHLVFRQAMPSVIFRLKGNMDARSLAPIDQAFIHNNNIWLPTTKGNGADLEIFVRGTKPPDAMFSIDAINVIVADFKSSDSPHVHTKVLKRNNSLLVTAKSAGKSVEPEYDLACWGEPEYSALQQAASATPLIEYIKGRDSYICSGTLLTDKRASFVPWFITANHCLTNQAVANTATFQWFYQATTCGGFFTDSRYTQTFGGAKLLWTDVKNDASFLKLKTPPPGGVYYMGWDSKRLRVGDLIWGVHHPWGDHTMVSQGNVRALNKNVKSDDGKVRILNNVRYIYGGTENGSSGSGLFFISNGSARLKGTLFGGAANDYQDGDYSSFSRYYPNIKRWLAAKKRR